MKEQKMKMSSPTCQVKFVAWKRPLKNWASWVQNLCSVHQSTWKNAGIYEAIMSTVYPITRHDDLILELASRWCSDTNVFVFPWGEATLTLEDMLVLGGFSALGVSVLSPLENDAKSVKIEERLERKRIELLRSRAQAALQSKWLEKFKGSGSDLEHAAFLSLWLSRFVFPIGPSAKSRINNHVFPVAARLSKGIKVALGPAVLAMLYKDLTALTRRQRFTQLIYQSGDNVGQVDLCALFHLVQIWAWERFPMLKPVPDCAYSGENFPRLARWSNVKILKHRDLTSAFNSADKAFSWCPYASSPKHEGRDPESSGRCIKMSELRGFDSCIVSYQPQRVLKQFGLDQDILSDKVDKSTGQNTSVDVKLFPTPEPFQPTMNGCKERFEKQQTQVKVENAVDCSPPGFPTRIEVIDLVDSDSDSDFSIELGFGPDGDYSLMVTEPTELHVPEAGSGRPLSFIDDTCFMEETSESETAEKQQTSPFTSAQIKREDDQDFVPCGFASQAKLVTVDVLVENDDKIDGGQVQQQHSKFASPRSHHESNEAVDCVNGSVHGLGEDNDVVAERKHNEIEGRSTGYVQNGLIMSCYAERSESYPNENSKDLDFDLEARISRLENIVYARRQLL